VVRITILLRLRNSVKVHVHDAIPNSDGSPARPHSGYLDLDHLLNPKEALLPITDSFWNVALNGIYLKIKVVLAGEQCLPVILLLYLVADDFGSVYPPSPLLSYDSRLTQTKAGHSLRQLL